jgi:deoxyribodipyrimidine photo-lyase
LFDFPAYVGLSSELDHLQAYFGSEKAGLAHLADYFADEYAMRYKETRNELDGWRNSTKFSPWLASGSLSARLVLSQLQAYEQDVGANESTYWIFFELFWREYFQWYALCHGRRLFAFKGIKNRKPLTSFYAERFQRWCKGDTPYPLVNACMKQLNATGYMSNRGRQIVASCFVNELGLDWRFGAAYFEQQLLDYDVAANWGNWQYLAGVGADPRGQRHFDIEKQTRQYDPDYVFIKQWGGDIHPTAIDSVDAADWPIEPLPWVLSA